MQRDSPSGRIALTGVERWLTFMFAALLTGSGSPATQSLVSQWENGETSISAERAVHIERATKRGISRADLRPDLFAPVRKRKAA